MGLKLKWDASVAFIVLATAADVPQCAPDVGPITSGGHARPSQQMFTQSEAAAG